MNRTVASRAERWVIAVIRAPFRVFGALVDLVYFLFFSRAAKRRAQSREKLLSDQIRRKLHFLFESYDAEVVSNGKDIIFPPPFDYAIVTLSVGTVRIRFLHGRGELDVELAARDAPETWHELSLVLSLIDVPEQVIRGTYSLDDVARLLETYIHEILEQLSDEHSVLKQRLDEAHRREELITRQWQTEINRKLYG